MDGQMQEGPSDLPIEFLGLTNYPGVLHNHDLNNLRLAVSCLEAGIGIELWALEKAWPGICNELWWFDQFHPGILHPATIAPINAMQYNEDVGSQKFTFDCPVFVAESRHGWPRTCNNVKSLNMTDLRRHLTERTGRGYAPQLTFLKLCTTCNEDFIDRNVFETRHGYRGELCNARRPQRRGANAKVQWELLYRQVEAAMAVQRLSTRMVQLSFGDGCRTDVAGQEQVNTDPAPSQTDLSLGPSDSPEQSTPQPANNHPDEAMPYLTPYQLIYGSDSDEGEVVRSSHD
ncbi:uncharacterized protein ALTATR162_LOCUS3795 [Alternaria atra]|uniref:Uncharacterized protein n=1 Tax=Alternaria atra TaxID=119953 RepID=A0A8J2N4I9_9PLEO|nr:uncharacterized protein ALTATR162_LOCUS3795 [Alternaria atra]CAG5155708.1 unnamed protein product [Alternaria atra]